MVSRGVPHTCSMIEIGIDSVEEIKTKKDFYDSLAQAGDQLDRESLKAILCNSNEKTWDKYLKSLGFKKVGKYMGNHNDAKGQPIPVYTYLLFVTKKIRNDYNRYLKQLTEGIGLNDEPF